MASDRPWESLRRERVYYAAGLRLGFDVQSARRTSDGMNRAEHQNPYPRPNREGVNPPPTRATANLPTLVLLLVFRSSGLWPSFA